MTVLEEAEVEDRELTFEEELDASLEKVWRALSVPELAAEWLVAPGRDDVSFRIVDAEPFSRMRYAWCDGAGESLVTVEIWPSGEGRTGFRLTHGARSSTMMLRAANGNSPPRLRRAA